MRLLCLALLLILHPGHAFQTSMSFSGNLERVGDKSISLQLPDRIVVDAMLPDAPPLHASALAARYRMGDQVELSCKPIHPLWEAATSRYQYLEVTAIHLQRHLSPDEVPKLLEARPREGKNLLARPDVTFLAPHKTTDLDAPGGRELEHARRINLDYVANMPNFVADETAKRERSGTKSGPWRHYDTVESEITFQGNRAVRQQIRRDGKPWDQPFDALPGFKWYEGFETEISPLFDPGCPTTLEYQGRSKVGGRQLLEYRFASPVNGCFPFFYFEYRRYNPQRIGHVFIDDQGGAVLQVDDEAIGFPSDFEFAKREEHVSWDYVKIGDNSHLLPVRASFLILYSTGTRYRIEVEYKNHRHFEASTNLTFH